RIVTINGETVKSAEQVSQFIRDHKGQSITLGVQRNGKMLNITASTRRLSDGRERLGFQPDEEIPYRRVGLSGSIAAALDENVEMVRVTSKAFGQVIAGKRSVRNTISGPIGIYRV